MSPSTRTRVLERSDGTVAAILLGRRDLLRDQRSGYRSSSCAGAVRAFTERERDLMRVRQPCGDYDWIHRDVVRRTGGLLIHSSTEDDFVPALAAAIEHMRTRYVLTYRPAGVSREGWHEIDVRVKDQDYEVVARRGYWGG